MYGSHSGGSNQNTDSNSFYGEESAYNMYAGNGNVFLGCQAGVETGPPSNPSNHNVFVGTLSGSRNPYGNYNTLLGDSTDAYHGSYPSYSAVYNSGAVGADVKVNFNNQMILGNNSEFVGIGESSDQEYGHSGPQWNLEISTEHNNAYSLPGLGGGTATSSNTYSGTGFSGLKFRDLTSNSTPVVASTFTVAGNPYPTGVLSVDGYGNVIYVPTCCSSSWLLTGNAGTSPGTNFLGTTDAEALEFKVDGQKSGWIDYTSPYNTTFGFEAGNSLGTNSTLNTAIGLDALYSNAAQSGNIAMGDSALYTQSYSTAFNSGNIAIGNSALYANQPASTTNSGYGNSAIGEWALRYNTTGYINSAVGDGALYANTTGAANTADGSGALGRNITGYYNTGIGASVLPVNTAGSSNTALGRFAGRANTASRNVFLGDSAGYLNTTGTFNTYVGYQAGLFSSNITVSNSSFIGYTAGKGTSAAAASNTIYLGNTSITAILGEVATGTYSDRRIKENIKENVPGLAFIDKLKPVTYNLNIHKQNDLMGSTDDADWDGKYDIEKIIQTGFIAQQVDSAAQACHYNFNGVYKPKTSDGLYALAYSDFVVPLVKAVQELKGKK